MEIIFIKNKNSKWSATVRRSSTSNQDSQDSQLKEAAEALKRENERIEAENRRKNKEIADLIKNIQNAK